MTSSRGALVLAALGVGLTALVLGSSRKSSTMSSSPPSSIPPTGPLDQRAHIVAVARGALQNPPEPDEVWWDVAPSLVGTGAAWCGGFALWVLHRAGLAKDVFWEVGKGFAYRLPTTRSPEPGDIAYFHKPYQHHALVVSVDGDQLVTIDGNQPGVAERLRSVSDATFFYSIGPLLQAA